MSFAKRISEKFDSAKTFHFSEMNPFSDVSSWVGSGSPSFDRFLKTLGYPVGIIEVRGESQSGKTTFSLEALKSLQRQYGEKGVGVILSSERRDNLPYARTIGVDVENVIVHRVTTIEDVFNRIHQTITNTKLAIAEMMEEELHKTMKKSNPSFKKELEKKIVDFGKPRYLFVWDSLGQTVSKQELEKAQKNARENTSDMAALGSASRSLAGSLRSFLALQDEEDVTLFIINRPYDRVDGRPGKKSYGGKAIMLYPTMRLELNRIQGVKVGDEEVGQITQVKTIKTDFDSPKQTFNIEIGYGLGFVPTKEDLAIGEKYGIVEKFGIAGGIFKMGKKEMKWTSRKQLYEILQNGDPLLSIFLKKLTTLVHNEVVQNYDKQ